MADSTTDSTQELPFAVPPRAFRLCVVQGDERATRTLHRGMRIVIGSSEEADLSLSDPTVSARHCEVSALEEGLLVRDLKSKNGLSLGAGKIDSFILRGRRGAFTIGHTRVVVDAGPEEEEGGEFGLLGSSEAMQRIRSEIRSLAPLRGAVLISGESGTGKDLVARALHEQSGRSGQYCPLNVAALSESLLDAELFGHEKGAFTGAACARRGLFEVAHRGTLFLDEIAELSSAGQAKLLRVVEDGHVRAVGAESSRMVDVRLVSASCRPLGEQIAKGAFREDLYHRLAMLEIALPPLRKRTEDIPILARHYLRKLKPELGEKHLEPAAEELLRRKPWRGNIRELFGILYRVAALTDEDCLGPSHFGPASQKTPQRPRLLPERAMELLDIHGSVSAAARAAGVPRTTFRSVLERRGLR